MKGMTGMKKFEHGGNIYQENSEKEWLDFSANINPLGLADNVQQKLQAEIASVVNYPEPYGKKLKQAIAVHYNISADEIIAGNGASELLYLFFQTERPRRVLIPVPTFSEYERAALSARCKVNYFSLAAENDFRFDWNKLIGVLPVTDCIILGNPNNPTGTLITRNELVHLLEEMRGSKTWLVVDESFIDFLQYDTRYTVRDLVKEYPNLLVIQSLTKFFALPGLRLGFGVGSPELIERLEQGKDVWSVNLLAQKAGIAALTAKEYQQKSRQFVIDESRWLYKELSNIEGVKPIQPSVNFILSNIKASGKISSEVANKMREYGILIRDCANYPGLDDSYIRVAVRSRTENCKLIEALQAVLAK